MNVHLCYHFLSVCDLYFFNEKFVKCQQIELSFKVKDTGPEAFQSHECHEKGGS